MSTHAGMVAIIGLPNAGKSSLLNRFLGSKLSIVTAAAQTTRQRIVGIDTREASQIVFLDTPGIVDPAYLLHHSMLDIIQRSVADADLVVLLLDGTRSPPELTDGFRELLPGGAGRLIVAINKADAADPEQLRRLSGWTLETFGTHPFVISARTGSGVEELRAELGARLPASPFLYPEDEISSQSVRFFVSELLREAAFELYQEEIPYSIAVEIDEFREGADPVYIRATLYVERESQKGIVIGRRGVSLRELGSLARTKIEAFLEQRVYLDLWIKVLPRWRKEPSELRRFGFPIPESQ